VALKWNVALLFQWVLMSDEQFEKVFTIFCVAVLCIGVGWFSFALGQREGFQRGMQNTEFMTDAYMELETDLRTCEMIKNEFEVALVFMSNLDATIKRIKKEIGK